MDPMSIRNTFSPVTVLSKVEHYATGMPIYGRCADAILAHCTVAICDELYVYRWHPYRPIRRTNPVFENARSLWCQPTV